MAIHQTFCLYTLKKGGFSAILGVKLGFACFFLTGCQQSGSSNSTGITPKAVTGEDVVEHYANLVLATYSDALTAAERMRANIEVFCEAPSAGTLTAARDAYINARIPYLQSEVFRFYEGPIDDENGPEGLLNAWPIDEAYIDSVVDAPQAGLINNPAQMPEISPEALLAANEKDGEENISAGYHAIEFLLWGQDLSEEGPGARPASDFVSAPNADRRRAFLLAATDLLVANLQGLVDEWQVKGLNYRQRFLTKPTDEALNNILTGMTMLSGFEMASERLMVAYDTQAQEDEHSCFSDTTHLDVIYDIQGINNVFFGSYTRLDDNETMHGASIYDLLHAADPNLAETLKVITRKSLDAARDIPAPFDQAILGEDDAEGRLKILRSVEVLEAQSERLKQAGEALGLGPIQEVGS